MPPSSGVAFELSAEDAGRYNSLLHNIAPDLLPMVALYIGAKHQLVPACPGNDPAAVKAALLEREVLVIALGAALSTISQVERALLSP